MFRKLITNFFALWLISVAISFIIGFVLGPIPGFITSIIGTIGSILIANYNKKSQG